MTFNEIGRMRIEIYKNKLKAQADKFQGKSFENFDLQGPYDSPGIINI